MGLDTKTYDWPIVSRNVILTFDFEIFSVWVLLLYSGGV
jgi:hypothetical protein